VKTLFARWLASARIAAGRCVRGVTHRVVGSTTGDGAAFAVFGDPQARHHFTRACLGPNAQPRARLCFHAWGNAAAAARRRARECGIVVIAEERAPRGLEAEVLRVPKVVGLTIELPPGIDDYLRQVRTSVRKTVLRLRERALRREIVRDPAWSDEFFARFHRPSSYSRHGSETILLEPARLRAGFAIAGTEFLRVADDTGCIAAVYARAQPDGYRLMRLGWRDADAGLFEAGAVTAVFWHAVERAYELGLRRVFMGGSAPFLDDGIIGFKAGWLARLDPGEKLGECRLLLDLTHEHARRFLQRRALIAFGADGSFVVFGGLKPDELGHTRCLLPQIARWWRLRDTPADDEPPAHPDLPASLRRWFTPEPLR
jgi:hypothetical protein